MRTFKMTNMDSMLQTLERYKKGTYGSLEVINSTREIESQLLCSGCRTVLLYPRGGPNVCCAICNVVTPVPPSAMEMAQLICGGCHTLLMLPRGASSIRCSCSHLKNIVSAATSNIVAHVSCGNCHTMLMYPVGAPSVKCALCTLVVCI